MIAERRAARLSGAKRPTSRGRSSCSSVDASVDQVMRGRALSGRPSPSVLTLKRDGGPVSETATPIWEIEYLKRNSVERSEQPEVARTGDEGRESPFSEAGKNCANDPLFLAACWRPSHFP